MGNNVGLDFGTTYSIISRLKDISVSNDRIVDYNFDTCKPSEGASYFQDSIVVRRLNDEEDPLIIGGAARASVGSSSTCVYDGFKMLLSESIEVDGKMNSLLEKKHYDKKYTPKYITEIFLKNIIDSYIKRYAEDNCVIDKLVVGIPEIWNEENKSYVCKDILGEIIKNDERIRSYEFVSEPALACAFFVENYKKKNNMDFEGNVLVVDYGGGTLDISLCNVGKNGKTNSISIPVKSGAGLNQEGVTGKAGLAFIEKVVLLTMEDNGVSEEQARTEKHFHANKFKVETILMQEDSCAKIKRRCRQNAGSDLSKLCDVLCEIEYRGDDFCVTYGTLVRAFDLVIKDVLRNKLQEMEDHMVEKGIITRTFEKLDNGEKKKKIDYGKNFKIVTIGGFCNFYLTEAEINDFYKISSSDERIEDVCCTREERELAVSYGAALMANDIISFKDTISYSYSIVTSEGKVFKVVEKGTEINEAEIHYAKYPDGRAAVFSGEKIQTLRLSPGKGKIKDCDAKHDLSLPKGSVVKIGFSFSKTEAINVHIFECTNTDEGDYETVSDKPHVIKLKDIYDVFGKLWDWEDEE